MNYVSNNLAPPRAGPCPSLHRPPPHSPSGKCTSAGIFFALPAGNGTLPAELIFSGNNATTSIYRKHIGLTTNNINLNFDIRKG